MEQLATHRVTGFEALRIMEYQWGRGPDHDHVSCPICKEPVGRLDYRRLAHLRAHLRAGWVPP